MLHWLNDRKRAWYQFNDEEVTEIDPVKDALRKEKKAAENKEK